MRVCAHHRVEHIAKAAEVAPEAPEPTIDRSDLGDSAEPAVSVRRQRIRMHDQRPRGMSTPPAHHRCAGPRRRRFDMVRAPFVEYTMKGVLVMEVAITA